MTDPILPGDTKLVSTLPLMSDNKNSDSSKILEINKQLYEYLQSIIEFDLESTPFLAKILNAVAISTKETPTNVVEALERQIREENNKYHEKRTHDALLEREQKFRHYIERAAPVDTAINVPHEFIEKADILFNLYLKCMYDLKKNHNSLVDDINGGNEDINDGDTGDGDDSGSETGINEGKVNDDFATFMKDLVNDIDYDSLDKDEQQKTLGNLQLILDKLKSDISIWEEIDI